MTMNTKRRSLLLLATLAVAGCTGYSTSSSQSPGVSLEGEQKWVMLPMVNHTDTPQAGLAAEAIAEHALRVRGVGNIVRYPAALSRDSLFEPAERRVVEEAQKWAREQGVRYGLTGVVEEWRYKVGIDGEPVAGLTLQVIDIASGRVLWSASGARSGWSRESLSGVANQLLGDMMGKLPLRTGSVAP
jgi:polysaccharide biosynthesis protein PelC